MIIHPIVLSLAVGALFGYSYGLLFLHIRKGVSSLSIYILFSILRLLLLLCSGMSLLLIPSIQPVILVLSFLIMFWMIIFMNKVPFNERSGTSQR